MKKFIIISILVFSAALVISCNDRSKPGKIYMPDMAESRAYETYADHSNLANKGINYNNLPVAGTVSRDEELPYHLKNDSTGYAQSALVANPLAKMSSTEYTETERLYLINCAICHGTKLDGNGPLYKDGNGPYAAKPAKLVGDPVIEARGEGGYYHVMAYGKNLMGSYASQLSRKQRWMIAQYIRLKQQEAKPSGNSVGADSTTKTSAPMAAATTKK